jgi:prophage tail gpP-like protein
MPKPTPGTMYTIVRGDTLWGISARAYGRPLKWRDIWQANQTVLRSGDPNMIYPGEVIFIPGDVVVESARPDNSLDLRDRDMYDFAVVLGGTETPVESANVTVTMDTFSDGWTAVMVDDPENPALWPYAYPTAEVYMGGRRVVTGLLYGVEPTTDTGGASVSLEGWSRTADLIDSTMKAPYQVSGVTLEQRARSLIEPLGVPVEWRSKDKAKFPRIKADRSQTIFSHLDGLAQQRGVCLSCTRDGKALFYDPPTEGSIGTLVEGTTTLEKVTTKFDGRKRFNVYTAFGSGPKKNVSGIAKDDGVPRSRMTAFTADDTSDGDVKQAAEYKRNQAIRDALTISLPVGGWYGPDGNLWTPATIITLVSKTLRLPKGSDFVIREVEFRWSTKGATATLKVCPPSAYTRGSLVDPWQR